MKSRTVRFNLSNVTKLPMAKINEEDSENNQTLGDIDFGAKSAEMIKLPSKKKMRNNAVFATSPEERAQQDLEDEEDQSRNRWYEYYRGIGYTTEKLVEAGLTKKLDKIIDPNQKKANVNVNDIKNQLKIGDKLKPKQIASLNKTKTVKVSELEELDETLPLE
jgi:ribosomal protein S17